MKIRGLHNEKACESILQPVERVASRVMNTGRHLTGVNTAGVSAVFTADYREDVPPDIWVGWPDGWQMLLGNQSTSTWEVYQGSLHRVNAGTHHASCILGG